MKFCFGDIVVVEGNLIGVVVKDWCSLDNEITHEVYVRYFSEIRTYNEYQMERYMVRHKYLSGDEIMYQDNAIHNTSTIKAPYTNKQINILRTKLDTVLELTEYPQEIIDGVIERLDKNGIICMQDLINISPVDLYSIQGITKEQYSNLVAIILNTCRNYDLPHKYIFDDYFNKNLKVKKGTKKVGRPRKQ